MLFTLILKDVRIMCRSILYSIFETLIVMLIFLLIGFLSFKFFQNTESGGKINDLDDFAWKEGSCFLDCAPEQYKEEPTENTILNLTDVASWDSTKVEIEDFKYRYYYVGIDDNNQTSKCNITLPIRDSDYKTKNWGRQLALETMDEQMQRRMIYFITKKVGPVETFKDQNPRLYVLPKTTPYIMISVSFQIMQYFILLVVVNITRNIVHEKSTFRPYLVSMGLPISTYYLAHFLFNYAKCLVIFIPGFVFFAQAQSSLIAAIYLCVSSFLYLIPAITFAFLIASFFKTGKAVILTCLVVWLALVTLPLLTIGSDTEILADYWVVLPTCLIFTFNMHYIGETLSTMTEFDEYSMFATSDRVLPLWALWLGLLINAAMMFGLAVWVDGSGKKVNLNECWRKVFRKKTEHNKLSHTTTQDTTQNETPTTSFTKRSRSGSDSRAQQEEETHSLLTGTTQDQANRKSLESDIDIHDVVKIYPTGEMAVKGLTMRAIRGQVSVLLGHNGCGKSSTFAMISGMSKPTEGTIEVSGIDVVSDIKEARKMIGLCPQYNPLIDKLTVWEHLKIVHTLKKAETLFEEDAEELLEAISLLEKKDELSKNLSGGMKRKLCMCMALIGESRVVLLDEPTAGMDVGARLDVQKMLRSIKKDRTILLTTHNMDEADKLADWVYVMSEGRIQASGSSQFLKSKFGGGWLITVVVEDAEKDAPILLDVCKKFVNETTIKDTRGQMTEFNVPSNDKNQILHMVKCLEGISTKDFSCEAVESLENLEKVKTIQVSSIGVSLNSLEQVFINVIDQCEKDTNKKQTAEQKSKTLQKLLEKKKEPPAFGPLSQFAGLSLKRMIYIRRNFMLHFLNLFIPLFLLMFIIYFLSTYKTSSGIQKTDIDINAIPTNSIVVIQSDSEAPEVEAFFKKNPNLIIRRFGTDRGLMDIVRTEQFFRRISVVVKVENQVATKVWINRKMNKAKAIGQFLKLNLPPGLMSVEYKFTFYWLIHVNPKTVYQALDFFVVVAFTVLLTYNISTCGFLHAEERVSNFKHQQFLTEMSPFIYWFSMYFWEFVIFALSLAGFMGILVFFGVVWGETTFKFLLISCLVWLATAPTIFIMSFIVDSPNKMITYIILFCFIIPFIKMFIDLIFGYQFPALRFTRFVFPSQPFINLIIWSYYNMDILLLNPIERLVSYGFPYDPEMRDIYVFDTINLAISATLYNFLLFFFSSRFVQRCINRLLHSGHFAEAKIQLNMEPCEAVEKEENDVRDGHLNPENCTVLVDELVKKFGGYPAVNGVYLGVKQGECFGLLGVNGAGKSTMIEILTGKQFACSGKATIGEVPVEKAVKVGYCPQFDAMLPEFTGRDILNILVRLHNYPNPSELVDELIECVGMTGNADKQIRYCSGGQKRKISMGMGILSRSWGHSGGGLIILDEPTAGVDPKARRDLWDIVVGMRRSERNRTGIMLTSHSMEECEALCTRIGILRKGEMIALATHQHLKSKYGNTFTLTIVGIKNENEKKEILEKIRATFGEKSILLTDEDDQTNNLVWEIPREKGEKWSTKMDEVKKIADELNIDNYFLVQSSLENTFIKMNSPNIEKKQV